MEVSIDIPHQYLELFEPTKKWRHYIFYGGRASAKSTTVALHLLIEGMKRKVRILCTREYQNSIKESVHSLLASLIEKHGLSSWEVTNDKIRNRKTGSEIIFIGTHNNAQSIKSMENIGIVWCEEASSMSEDSMDILIPTIRAPGSYLIWTYNPITEFDPVWVKLAKNPDERTYVKKVNSTDVERLLSPEIIAEREKMHKENLELYMHIWEGFPLTANTGSVFGKQLAQAREDGRIGKVPYDESLGVYTAWDLGVGDATSIWFFQTTPGGEIHFIDQYESSGEDLGHYISVIQNKPYQYNKHFLPHDAKSRELQTGTSRVEFFNARGIYNIDVLRPTRFTLGQDDISLVARPKFSKCWFDEEKCKRGLECLRAYHFSYDEKNKLLKDKPEHDWSSHSSSAFIYALIAETEQVEVQTKINFKTFTPEVFAGEQNTGF